MSFCSCPPHCHPVRSTLQTCKHNCLDSRADRARSWLSSSTFHARAKFPFLVFVGDTNPLPSSKGSCLSWYSRLLTSSTAQACKHFEPSSLLQYRKWTSREPNRERRDLSVYLPGQFLNTVEYGELSARLIGSVRLSSAAASPYQKDRAAPSTWYFEDMSLVKTPLIHQKAKQITAGGKK